MESDIACLLLGPVAAWWRYDFGLDVDFVIVAWWVVAAIGCVTATSREWT